MLLNHLPPLNRHSYINSDNKDKAEALTELNIIDEAYAKLFILLASQSWQVETSPESLQTDKAAGPASFNNRVSNSISSPISDLFNYSLSKGYFSEA